MRSSFIAVVASVVAGQEFFADEFDFLLVEELKGFVNVLHPRMGKDLRGSEPLVWVSLQQAF